ncbi:MAG: hypothetical protein JWM14_595 [Chitinophagaceae bacterium]|nr:hypothetical protein [Chitinophagaceae bacterium]
MKNIHLLSIALCSTMLASCSNDHKKGKASDTSDRSSYVPVDSSLNRTNHNNNGQAPTYDASASNKPLTDDNNKHVSTSTKEDYSTAPSNLNRKARVDHSTQSFNGRSKNDSIKINSGVAGEQGGGAGVGDGGSINEASKNKR